MNQKNAKTATGLAIVVSLLAGCAAESPVDGEDVNLAGKIACDVFDKSRLADYGVRKVTQQADEATLSRCVWQSRAAMGSVLLTLHLDYEDGYAYESTRKRINGHIGGFPADIVGTQIKLITAEREGSALLNAQGTKVSAGVIAEELAKNLRRG